MADIAVIESQVKRLETDTADQWSAIDDLRRYMRKLVPVWVTVVVSVLTFITGGSLTFAGMILRFSSKQWPTERLKHGLPTGNRE